jgi:hypothetical protein
LFAEGDLPIGADDLDGRGRDGCLHCVFFRALLNSCGTNYFNLKARLVNEPIAS